MSESINVNKSIKQFMVLDVISRRIEDADRIVRIMKMNNSEVESFKAGPYFSYQFLPNKIRVFMPKGVSADSSAFNFSVVAVKGVTLRFDS
ncbi:MAG: hypothetical protein M3M89_02390 [Thermoproteota archaeon]|nr:hypothetical protein [Thermoproteota archaeon]